MEELINIHPSQRAAADAIEHRIEALIEAAKAEAFAGAQDPEHRAGLREELAEEKIAVVNAFRSLLNIIAADGPRELRPYEQALALAKVFLEHLATPHSEPLNSINGSRKRADRGMWTAQLRGSAAEILRQIRELTK